MSTLTMPGRTDAAAGRRVTRLAARLLALAERARARIARERSVRRTARDLAQLDDRMLQDIGLRRTGMHYAARHGCDLVSLTLPNPLSARQRSMERE